MPSDAFMGRISRYLAWLAGAIILLGCALPITIDVLSRFFLGHTIVESFEISGFALAASIGLGMGYTVSTKANIRVDFLVAKLPRRVRWALDLFAALSLAALAVALAWFSFTVLAQSWAVGAKSQSTLQIPMFLPQGFWWIGLFWFATVAVLTPLLAIVRLLKGDEDGFARALATADLADEMSQIGMNEKGGTP